jgi:putative oxidoreductase
MNVDLAGLLLRLILGGTIAAHGWNHAFGGGGLAGTAGWFDSIGIRPGRVHAMLATLTELGAGLLLILGLLTPLAAAGVVGTMLVALVANHIRNGFFIFRPGEGYEYVLTLLLAGFALAGIGAGKWSIDYHIDSSWLWGWKGLLIAAVFGVGGAATPLAVYWKPEKKPTA